MLGVVLLLALAILASLFKVTGIKILMIIAIEKKSVLYRSKLYSERRCDLFQNLFPSIQCLY